MKRKNGFTLMEMLIVVTIIAVLAGIIIKHVSSSVKSANIAAHKKARVIINAQLEAYFFTNAQYPTEMTNSAWKSVDSKETYMIYFPEGVPVTCNQGAKWSIIEGRVGTDGSHSSHETGS